MLEIEKTFHIQNKKDFDIHEKIILQNEIFSFKKFKQKKSIHFIFENSNDFYKDRIRIDFSKGYFTIFYTPKIWLPQNDLKNDFQCYNEEKRIITIKELNESFFSKKLLASYFKKRKKYYYNSTNDNIILSFDKVYPINNQILKEMSYLEIESNNELLIDQYHKLYLSDYSTINEYESKWFVFKTDKTTQISICEDFDRFVNSLYRYANELRKEKSNEIFRLNGT